MLKINKKSRFIETGFTLIEIILYLAIVGIILVAVIDFHFTLGGTTNKLAANVDVSNNKRTAINAIEYLIRNADGLLKDVNEKTCSDLSADPPSLALYFDNDNYLPGTCVGSGGGVRLTASTTLSRIVMQCYPNMATNGRYNACSTVSFPIGNTYYLTSPSVQVGASDLNFSTSTATTTHDTFLTINTSFSVSNISDGQRGLAATSTASSTVIMRNEWFYDNAFLGWWKMDDGSTNLIFNERNSQNTSCPNSHAVPSTPTVFGFTRAGDFEAGSSQYCVLEAAGGPKYNFNNNGFTLAAWFQPESLSGEQYIFSKIHNSLNLGYALGVNGSNAYCRVCDGAFCSNITDSYTLSTAVAYHIACVYNPHSTNVIKLYVYQEENGGRGTTTSNTLVNLANYDTVSGTWDDLALSTSTGFAGGTFVDGLLNDLQAHARPLSDQEIWALQSRGAVKN